MNGVYGFKGRESGEMNERQNAVVGGVRKLMRHKYGDVFLLCSVAVAFGMLLIVSAIG